MYLVVGATGLLGSAICTRLRQRGKNVRAIVRPTARPETIQSPARRRCGTGVRRSERAGEHTCCLRRRVGRDLDGLINAVTPAR